MRFARDTVLNTRVKSPLALALAAGVLVASPAIAQSEYYEEADETLERERQYDRVRTQDQDWQDRETRQERRRYEAEEDEWTWSPEGEMDYETQGEWEFDTRADARTYEQFYTTRYEGRVESQQPREDGDTGYYYDPEEVRQLDERAQQGQPMTAGTRQVQGELQSYRKITFRGQPEAHTVVKVRTSGGRIALVNLGPRVDLTQMGLQQGDEVVVQGRRGAINNHPAIIASNIHKSGEAGQIEQTGDELWLQQGEQRQQRQRQHQDDWMQSQGERRQDQMMQDRAMSARTVSGTLQSHGEVELRGEPSPHTIVELKLDDGQRALLDVGPNVKAEDLNLQRGDKVIARGHRGTINRVPVLMVGVIDVDGQRTALRGPSGTRMQGQTAQGQDQMYRQQRVARQVDTGAQGQSVSEITANWPSSAKEAAQEMQRKYGEPDIKTREALVWQNSGPFVKTVVHAEEVQHNFPSPHEDVLEQFVYYEVPADKMDELSKFDGSIIVYRTDGLISSRCHKEPMNILALNLADKIIKDDMSVDEARDKMREAAQAHERGEPTEMTGQLEFEQGTGAGEPDSPEGEEGGGLFDTGGTS